MDLQFYRLLHLGGLVALFAALGAMTLRGKDQKASKLASMLHGLAILAMLVAGFGLLAKLGITDFPWPVWVFAKFGIWLILGFLPLAVKKRWVPALLALVVAIALAVTAAWLAEAKPTWSD